MIFSKALPIRRRKSSRVRVRVRVTAVDLRLETSFFHVEISHGWCGVLYMRLEILIFFFLFPFFGLTTFVIALRGKLLLYICSLINTSSNKRNEC